MNPTDLSFLPFLLSKSTARTCGSTAMTSLPDLDMDELDANKARNAEARAYDAAVSEGWPVAPSALHCQSTQT